MKHARFFRGHLAVCCPHVLDGVAWVKDALVVRSLLGKRHAESSDEWRALGGLLGWDCTDSLPTESLATVAATVGWSRERTL